MLYYIHRWFLIHVRVSECTATIYHLWCALKQWKRIRNFGRPIAKIYVTAGTRETCLFTCVYCQNEKKKRDNNNKNRLNKNQKVIEQLSGLGNKKKTSLAWCTRVFPQSLNDSYLMKCINCCFFYFNHCSSLTNEMQSINFMMDWHKIPVMTSHMLF